MNCRKAVEMILNGETGIELEQHMARCPECAALARDCREIRLPASSRIQVPPALDRTVLDFAAAHAGKESSVRTIRFPHRPFWISAAAAVFAAGMALCLFMTHPVSPAETRMAVSVPGAAAGMSVPDRDAGGFAVYQSAAALDSELLSLSLEIDDTEPDLLAVASLSSYDLYAANSYYDF